MKNCHKLLLLLFLGLFSTVNGQKPVSKEYARISGTVSNLAADSLIIGHRWESEFSDNIAVDKNGDFEYTIKTEPEYFLLYDGKNLVELHLKNGDDITVNYDAQRTSWAIDIEGTGKQRSSYLAEYQKIEDNLLEIDRLLALNRKNFDLKMKLTEERLLKALSSVDTLETTFINAQKDRIQKLIQSSNTDYDSQEYIKEKLAPGKPSPVFTAYENYSGGTTSLSDFKGSYVYIDLWATWCAPCIAEIPYLQKLEKKYKDRNIKFVSISVDKPKLKSRWKEMIAEYDMTGVQLFAGDNKEFYDAYRIIGIPRFILIDPEGKIVDANAPIPSKPSLSSILDELLQ